MFDIVEKKHISFIAPVWKIGVYCFTTVCLSVFIFVHLSVENI